MQRIDQRSGPVHPGYAEVLFCIAKEIIRQAHVPRHHEHFWSQFCGRRLNDHPKSTKRSTPFVIAFRAAEIYLKLIFLRLYICIDSNPPNWPFVGIHESVYVLPFMCLGFLFQKGIPSIIHRHSVIPSHSIDITGKRRKPSSCKRSTSTGDNRVNHAKVVRIEIAECCEVKIIIEESQTMMLTNGIEKCLVSFICGNIQNLIWFPKLLGVLVPFVGW
jgi:hypothetical protein